MEAPLDLSQFVLPNDTPIVLLECRTAFENLSDKEKHYAHYISQASWYGGLICLFQTSPESPGIFVVLQQLFRAQTADELKQLASESGLSEDEFQAFLIYAAAFYGNVGNYKSFGDTKIIPALPQDKLGKFLKSSKAYRENLDEHSSLVDKVLGKMYSLSPREQQLGLGEDGVTSYFSDNCDIKDAEVAKQFMMKKGISAYNTRLFKSEKNGEKSYEVRLASANSSGNGEGDLGVLGIHQFTPEKSAKPITFTVTRGDYAQLMQLLADNLRKAKEFVANETEGQMFDHYITSFMEGSISAHKEGSRYWIRNKGPIVETYIGFIESYRDPFGVRGEFEGFVAMVNKEMSKKFTELVSRAEHFLPLLPWSTVFEKDKFLRPDFTSLDVLTFGSSGVPAGINIPNYDDIRQSEGFKNVSLGNVLSAGYKDTKITFLDDKDTELYKNLKMESFEVQVGLHELLGHGSGKLFIKNDDGSYNFDIEKVKNPFTHEKITSYYEHNETWDSKFKVISSSYEECRAECVGIYLCLSSEVLQIFGHTGDTADDIIYINWLNMVRAGLLALEFYTPSTCAWRQAHMQARYVILRVLLEAGEGLVTIKKTLGTDGKLDLVIHLDRSKINTVGKKTIGDFLTKLQVYKSLADYKSGKALYDKYSVVCDKEEPHFLTLRDIVMDRKLPRKIYVQCNTRCQDEKVVLVDYENTPQALIQSFADRFPDRSVDQMLLNLWEKDSVFFP